RLGATDRGEYCQAAGAFVTAKKRRPPKRPPNKLKSVVALPPSIDIPRTITIRLTDATLDRPMRRAAVPRTPSATVVAVIAWVVPVVRVITVAVVALRLNGSGRSNCCRPDKAQCNSSFC